jgi:hypothetical protein
MKEGRLRDQAFVRYADAATATRALERLLGLMVDGKPWVVAYARGSQAVGAPPP